MLHLFESITEDTVTVLVIFFYVLQILEVEAPLCQITLLTMKLFFFSRRQL